MAAFILRLATLIMALMLGASKLNADPTPQTVVSKTPIPERCKAVYQDGLSFFQRYVEQGGRFDEGSNYRETFEEVIAQSSDDEICQFVTSMALLDSLQTWQQQVVLEVQIEMYLLDEEDRLTDSQLKQVYQPRFQRLGLKWETVFNYQKENEGEARKLTKTFASQMHELSGKKSEAVPFGRFVFLRGPIPVKTAYDFEQKNNASVTIDRKGQPKLVKGSYARMGERIFEIAIDTAQEYLKWRPGLIYGEDSYLYGAFWRALGVDQGPSIREIKENHFFKIYLQQMNMARRYGFDTKALRDVYQQMINKQKAYLERDLEGLKRVYYGALAAPLVPIGMVAGGALLAQTGWFAATSSTGFAFTGGSFWTASNIAAASSLLTISGMAGLGAYHAYQGYKESDEDNPYRITDALDQIVVAAVGAIPTAAIAPVQVGLTALGAQSLWAGGRFLLAGGVNLGRAAMAAGFRGSLSKVAQVSLQLPGKAVRLPGFVVKHVLQAWYKNPRLLAIHYGVDVALVFGYEAGYRQLALKGEDKFIFKDADGNTKFNHNALYSMVGTVVLSPLSKPLILIPSFTGRYMAFRAFGLLSSVMTHLVVSGHVDMRRLAFDQVYWGTVGTANGEIDRYVKLSSFVRQQPIAKQAALLILFKVLLVKPIETPLRIYFQDRFVKGDLRPVDEIKSLVKQSIALDLGEFTDEELNGALDQAFEELGTEKPDYLK